MWGELADPQPPVLAALDVADRRLNGPPQAPVAIALSGGGDSMALLYLARRWAARAARPLVAFTVDHQLQPASAAWARFAADACTRLGIAHRTLSWTGAKPASGLPAAARAARHALIAAAAREAGARVVMMGHTADDVLEAELMRASGATTPSPRTWSPSPAWPEGRGVFLLRPLLACRRAALRDWLRGQGVEWIEDPANDDARYGRTLARRHLAALVTCAPPCVSSVPNAAGAFVEEGRGGDLTAPRRAAADADPGVLGALALCAAGTTRPPRRTAIARLASRMALGETFVASLAGARIEAVADEVRACREAGELSRRPPSLPTGRGRPLPEGVSVFDGRFEVNALVPGWMITHLQGHAGRLPRAERAALRGIPAAVRGVLPLALSPSGQASCPILAQAGPVFARPLALARLRAALGAIVDEAALWRVAEWPVGP